MRIGFHGQILDEPVIRAGFIGCGSHSFRNIYPALQFAPVQLVATCDLNAERSAAFAQRFGALRSYTDYHRMLGAEELDAVFIVTGYDASGRPLYPTQAIDCLQAKCHVWIEKPPAATCAEIERMQSASAAAGRHVMVGLKKMFCPANEKAYELAHAPEFGHISLVTAQYPQSIPTPPEMAAYLRDDQQVPAVASFLDHLCHPAALLVFLLGMPEALTFERSSSGAGLATFTYQSGAIASLALTQGSAHNGGMERTFISSDQGRHIVVENNIRLSYHRNPPVGYGDTPSYFTGSMEQATAVWQPEFSLGQLYNKGLFLLGYYNEVNEFVRAILEQRAPRKGTLEQAWQITRIFEAFAEGPRKRIDLRNLRK